MCHQLFWHPPTLILTDRLDIARVIDNKSVTECHRLQIWLVSKISMDGSDLDATGTNCAVRVSAVVRGVLATCKKAREMKIRLITKGNVYEIKCNSKAYVRALNVRWLFTQLQTQLELNYVCLPYLVTQFWCGWDGGRSWGHHGCLLMSSLTPVFPQSRGWYHLLWVHPPGLTWQKGTLRNPLLRRWRCPAPPTSRARGRSCPERGSASAASSPPS